MSQPEPPDPALVEILANLYARWQADPERCLNPEWLAAQASQPA